MSTSPSIPIPSNLTMPPGETIGDRYRVIQSLGQGGFGRTYLCQDANRFDEPCVLKEFAPQVHGTYALDKAAKLFQREAGVLYRLQHPQIPPFRELLRTNAGLFLVQDHVAGKNYRDIMAERRSRAQGPFSEAEVRDLLLKLLPVLDYIHQLGVIHRDISPDNIIRREADGVPVLIDFGGVKQVAANAEVQFGSGDNTTAIPTRLGKLGYAPNEQMQRGIVSSHSDLYALAATSLVLLTGREPAELVDPQDLAWNWQQYVTLTPDLNQILERMLAARPSDRYQSATEAISALRSNQVSPNSTPNPKPGTEATVVAIPQIGNNNAATTGNLPIPAREPNVLKTIGFTWLWLFGGIGAIALGWMGASLIFKQPSPNPNPGNSADTSNPNSSPDSSPTSSPIASPTTSGSSPNPSTGNIAGELSATARSQIDRLGLDSIAVGNIVGQIFTSQNPSKRTTNITDAATKAQLNSIAIQLAENIDRSKLSTDARRRLGSFTAKDWENWRQTVNQRRLSTRALANLADVRYDSVTEFNAQKLNLSFEKFLATPLGQLYQAISYDRVQEIVSGKAIEEIKFAPGSTSGSANGRLEAGNGKAFILQLAAKQELKLTIEGGENLLISFYPPTSNLGALIDQKSLTDWEGQSSRSGYYEIVIVSKNGRTANYKLTINASALPATESAEPAEPNEPATSPPQPEGGTTPSPQRSGKPQPADSKPEPLF
jgi:serine/threonine protein kinase, bacterial